MQNYMINENTVAILKREKRTIIYSVENYRVINKNIKKILEDNCNFYGSSLDCRKNNVRKLLKIKYKVPFNITDSNNIILIQIDSLRKKECLFIILDKIIDYEVINNKVNIICVNNNIFKTNLSKYSFEKIFINSFILNNILRWRNLTNMV